MWRALAGLWAYGVLLGFLEVLGFWVWVAFAFRILEVLGLLVGALAFGLVFGLVVCGFVFSVLLRVTYGIEFL